MAQAGAPVEVYDHPATPAVASFLGASLLDGSYVLPHEVKLAPEGRLRAEIPRLELDALGVREGDRVFVDVRSAKIERPVPAAGDP